MRTISVLTTHIGYYSQKNWGKGQGYLQFSNMVTGWLDAADVVGVEIVKGGHRADGRTWDIFQIKILLSGGAEVWDAVDDSVNDLSPRKKEIEKAAAGARRDALLDHCVTDDGQPLPPPSAYVSTIARADVETLDLSGYHSYDPNEAILVRYKTSDGTAWTERGPARRKVGDKIQLIITEVPS